MTFSILNKIDSIQSRIEKLSLADDADVNKLAKETGDALEKISKLEVSRIDKKMKIDIIKDQISDTEDLEEKKRFIDDRKKLELEVLAINKSIKRINDIVKDNRKRVAKTDAAKAKEMKEESEEIKEKTQYAQGLMLFLHRSKRNIEDKNVLKDLEKDIMAATSNLESIGMPALKVLGKELGKAVEEEKARIKEEAKVDEPSVTEQRFEADKKAQAEKIEKIKSNADNPMELFFGGEKVVDGVLEDHNINDQTGLLKKAYPDMPEDRFDAVIRRHNLTGKAGRNSAVLDLNRIKRLIANRTKVEDVKDDLTDDRKQSIIDTLKGFGFDEGDVSSLPDNELQGLADDIKIPQGRLTEEQISPSAKKKDFGKASGPRETAMEIREEALQERAEAVSDLRKSTAKPAESIESIESKKIDAFVSAIEKMKRDDDSIKIPDSPSEAYRIFRDPEQYVKFAGRGKSRIGMGGGLLDTIRSWQKEIPIQEVNRILDLAKSGEITTTALAEQARDNVVNEVQNLINVIESDDIIDDEMKSNIIDMAKTESFQKATELFNSEIARTKPVREVQEQIGEGEVDRDMQDIEAGEGDFMQDVAETKLGDRLEQVGSVEGDDSQVEQKKPWAHNIPKEEFDIVVSLMANGKIATKEGADRARENIREQVEGLVGRTESTDILSDDTKQEIIDMARNESFRKALNLFNKSFTEANQANQELQDLIMLRDEREAQELEEQRRMQEVEEQTI